MNERNEKLGFLGEEERPILANSEFLLTQEGFAGTSNKVHVRLVRYRVNFVLMTHLFPA